MTVIAWDGTTLAADKLALTGKIYQQVTKIFRYNDELIGITGDLSVGMEMKSWYMSGGNPDKYPASNRDPDKGCSLIIIKSNGTAWKYEATPYPFQSEGEFCAFGSGDEAALVAMCLGQDAKGAVLMASMYNAGCGLGVDALKLVA